MQDVEEHCDVPWPAGIEDKRVKKIPFNALDRKPSHPFIAADGGHQRRVDLNRSDMPAPSGERYRKGSVASPKFEYSVTLPKTECIDYLLRFEKKFPRLGWRHSGFSDTRHTNLLLLGA